jgi:hypothetical protein
MIALPLWFVGIIMGNGVGMPALECNGLIEESFKDFNVVHLVINVSKWNYDEWYLFVS